MLNERQYLWKNLLGWLKRNRKVLFLNKPPHFLVLNLNLLHLKPDQTIMDTFLIKEWSAMVCDREVNLFYGELIMERYRASLKEGCDFYVFQFLNGHPVTSIFVYKMKFATKGQYLAPFAKIVENGIFKMRFMSFRGYIPTSWPFWTQVNNWGFLLLRW